MKVISYFLCCCVAILVAGMEASAQQKVKFHSQNYVGLLEGETGSAFLFQTINGIKSGTWTAGIGTGLDFYRYRTVPVFLSVSKFLRPAGKSFYVSLDGGINYHWSKSEDLRFTNIIGQRYKSSLYWGAGIGYRFPLKNQNDAFLLNVGYSYKRFLEDRQMLGFCNIPPCAPTNERFDYKLNRLSLRLGFEF